MAKQVAWQGKKGHGTASQGIVRQSRVWGGMAKRAVRGRPSYGNTGQRKEGQRNLGQVKVKQVSAEQGSTRQGKAGQGKERGGKAEEGCVWPHRAGTAEQSTAG